MKKGKLIIFSGPSGVGKDTILKFLLNKIENLELSVSVTTRPPRIDEINGKDYYFVSEENFLKKAKNGEMLEYAKYCGNYYGTPMEKIEEKLSKGINIILEIEVQGAIEVLKKKPESLSIFIIPPSLEVLKERLMKRGTDNAKIIEKRILEAKKEIEFSKNYKHIVVNDDIERCTKEILKIIFDAT